MIVSIAGKAGVGKDTAAQVFVDEYGFDRRSLADPIKRICKEVFSFSPKQLYGPSEERNREDGRYIREDGNLLTPRYALQRLGTEWGRHCCPDVWVNYLVRRYSDTRSYRPHHHVVVSDVRFPNEVNVLRQYGVVILLRRAENSLSGEAAVHSSETALDNLYPSTFDTIIHNDGTIAELKEKIRGFYLLIKDSYS